MTVRPDFSPAMLARFISIRCWAVACRHGLAPPCKSCRRTYENNLRKRAQLTWAQMANAKAGRLAGAAPRGRLWRAMAISPADNAIRLLDGGKQEAL